MQYKVYVTRIPVVLKRLPVVERAACICFCFFSFTIISIIIFIMTIILNGQNSTHATRLLRAYTNDTGNDGWCKTDVLERTYWQGRGDNYFKFICWETLKNQWAVFVSAIYRHVFENLAVQDNIERVVIHRETAECDIEGLFVLRLESCRAK